MLPLDLNDNKKCAITRTLILNDIEAVVLENGAFSVTVLPTEGGRIFSIFYKKHSKELLSVFPHPHSARIRGGMYSNFPVLFGEKEASCRNSWECEIVEDNDRTVSVQLFTVVEELQYRTDIGIKNVQSQVILRRLITLHAGEERVRVEEILENRNQWSIPVNWAGSISLQAANEDTLISPVDEFNIIESENTHPHEVAYNKVANFPLQLISQNTKNGTISFSPSDIPTDFTITFPQNHAPILALSAEQNSFLLQFLATSNNMASDTSNSSLVLPPKIPVHFSFTIKANDPLDIINNDNIFSDSDFSLIKEVKAEQISQGKIAVWRTAEEEIILKDSSQSTMLLMPSFTNDSVLNIETLPLFDTILCSTTLSDKLIEQVFERTMAHVFGPADLRHDIISLGVDATRNVALSPGASYALENALITATGATLSGLMGREKIGYAITLGGITIYHAGVTEFVGDFAAVGDLSPDIVFLPIAALTPFDTVQAVRLIKPKIVIPLGKSYDEEVEFKVRISHQFSDVNVHILEKESLFIIDREVIIG